MTLAICVVILGLVLLVWSADLFVASSASVARHFGMPPLLIGMIIVGFGTSLPEMLVSSLSAYQGNPGIALGNAYGSNITNIALILGVTALLRPISVHSKVLMKELPLLAAVSFLALLQAWDGEISRFDALILLGVFGGLLAWTIWQGIHKKGDPFAAEIEQDVRKIAVGRAIILLIFSLLVLIASSRMLVWGAVEIAHGFGVSDLIIGLTVVAVGTSLPELASSVLAARRGEHDIALGNILGSNLFNTLVVVGLAGVIAPMGVGGDVLHRDMLVMISLTMVLFVLGYGRKGSGRINRFEGGGLLLCYLAYNFYLINSTF